jgi:hypothetical protein
MSMATMAGARHGRQIRLPEVGEEGQARLEATEVVLGGADDAREVEATYLRQAGMKVREAHASASAKAKAKARPDEKLAVEAVKALGIRDVTARDVAEGAMRALVAMRTVLGVNGEEGNGS